MGLNTNTQEMSDTESEKMSEGPKDQNKYIFESLTSGTYDKIETLIFFLKLLEKFFSSNYILESISITDIIQPRSFTGMFNLVNKNTLKIRFH